MKHFCNVILLALMSVPIPHAVGERNFATLLPIRLSKCFFFLSYFTSRHNIGFVGFDVRIMRVPFFFVRFARGFIACGQFSLGFSMWSIQFQIEHVGTSVSASLRSLGFIAWSPQSRLHRMATSVSTSSHGHFSLSFMTWSL